MRGDLSSERLQRSLRVLDDDRRQVSGPRAEDSHRTGPPSLAGVVVPVGVLACEGYEEASGLSLATVEYGGRGHLHGPVAGDLSADDHSDLIQTERNHPPSKRRAVFRPRIENLIRGGNTALPSLES